MMKNALLGCAALTATGSVVQGQDASSANAIYSGGAPWGNVLGWQLGSQTWTFYSITLEETIKKIASLGLRIMESGPISQKIRPDTDFFVNVAMTKPQRNLIRTLLADNDMALPSFGGVDITSQAMEFALDMGIGTLMAEPPYEQLPEVDKLAQEYGVNVAIHNHPATSELYPAPSLYADYRVTLERLKDLSPRIGVCLDTGHFRRSGFDPVDAVRALKGRIITVHLKDLSKKEPGPDCYDVPWGTGVCNIASVLAELRKQHFRGSIFAEYEHFREDTLMELGECARYFNDQARRLSLE